MDGLHKNLPSHDQFRLFPLRALLFELSARKRDDKAAESACMHGADRHTAHAGDAARIIRQHGMFPGNGVHRTNGSAFSASRTRFTRMRMNEQHAC